MLRLVAVASERMKANADAFKDKAGEVKRHFCAQHYRNIAIVLVVLTVIGVVIYLIAK